MEIIKKGGVFLFFISLIILSGCKKYTSNIMLKTEDGDINWSAEYKKVIDEYKLRIGDKIQYTLYTNLGEAIIDPSGKLVAAPAAGGVSSSAGSGALAPGKPVYEVSEAGTCFFPVIGKFEIAGLKISQLDSLLTKQYESYYNEVYIISKVINRRVVVLGGRGSKVIPLENANTSLLEILALYGGLNNEDKAYNIRIVRGDLKNPEITVINLRTVQDMKESIVRILPDDIIYVEPVRAPISESAREYMFVFQMVNILFTLTILVERLTAK